MGWYSSDPTFKFNHGESKTFVHSCLANMSDSGAALVTLDETKTLIFFPDILLSYKTLHKKGIRHADSQPTFSILEKSFEN